MKVPFMSVGEVRPWFILIKPKNSSHEWEMVFTSSYLIWCHIHNKHQIFRCARVGGCICMCVHTHIQTHTQTHTHLVFLICFLYEIWCSRSGVTELYWQFHLTTPGSFFGNLSPEIDVLVLHKTVFFLWLEAFLCGQGDRSVEKSNKCAWICEVSH